jgi:ABC-type spermidine/putrescine transport system permease subunit I
MDYALDVIDDSCDVIANASIPIRAGDLVSPGMTYQFLEMVTMPAAEQSCALEVRLMQAGERLGASQTIHFIVQAPPNAARNWTLYD